MAENKKFNAVEKQIILDEKIIEMIGFDKKVDGVRRNAEQCLFDIEDLDFSSNYNFRYNEENMKKFINTEDNLIMRVEGNPKRMSNYIRGNVNVTEEQHVIAFDSDLVKEIIKGIKRICNYQQELSPTTCKDESRLLKLFQKVNEEKYLVVDGNSICAVLSVIQQELKKEDSLLKTKQVPYSKKVRGILYERHVLSKGKSRISKMKRDFQIVELLSMVVERNMSSWTKTSLTKEYCYILTRMVKRIILEYFHEEEGFNMRYLWELLNVADEYFVPKMKNSGKIKLEDPINARILYAVYRENKKDAHNEESGELGVTAIGYFSNLFEKLLINSSDSKVITYKKAEEYLRLLFKHLAIYGNKAQELGIVSSRDRFALRKKIEEKSSYCSDIEHCSKAVINIFKKEVSIDVCEHIVAELFDAYLKGLAELTRIECTDKVKKLSELEGKKNEKFIADINNYLLDEDNIHLLVKMIKEEKTVAFVKIKEELSK